MSLEMILWAVLGLLVVGFLVFSLRFKWFLPSISYEFPRILMYHSINEHLPKNKSKFNRLRVPPREFERQIAWLKKRGFTSFTLGELIRLEKIPPKAVIITFDDGYADNFTNAFEILKKYNFKATIFIVVDRFTHDWASDRDTGAASAELNNEEMLSDAAVREMIESGLIEIGSHTMSHANLLSLSRDEKIAQIAKSKENIERIFGIKCESFSYPFGFFDEESALIVAKHGYKAAVSTENGVFDAKKYSKFKIPRIMISGRQGLLAFILKMKNGRVR